VRATFPYAGLAAEQVWKTAVGAVSPAAIDPQGRVGFTIPRNARIASAGSCFARRVAAGLRAAGYTYFVTEPGPDGADAGRLVRHHDGTYSARYGEIYTTLQLAQLAQRCVGTFVPDEPAWVRGGRYHDPFRPRVEPDGFSSPEALETDRAAHLAAVRRLLTESDVFIFTLGLTEVWCSRNDGSAFPLCPGAGIGTFDPDRYEYRNLSVAENVRYLEQFLEIAWSLNPGLRIILTVSPIPLVATIEPHHVIQSTVYSKSVLRVAAETIRSASPAVEYFAAYEMVASGYDGEDHFTADRRDVREETVARVMDSFIRAFGTPDALPTIELTLDLVAANTAPVPGHDPCDEVFAEQFVSVRDCP
jgi:hypothetical protein